MKATIPKSPFPTVKVLSAMVQADDTKAVNYILTVLKFCEGNVTETARALGVATRSLYAWRDGNTRLREGFEKHALGRPGAGIHATQARLEQRASDAKDEKRPRGPDDHARLRRG